MGEHARAVHGQCERSNGASWLQLTDVGPSGDAREQVAEESSGLCGVRTWRMSTSRLATSSVSTALQSGTYQLESFLHR